MSDLIFIVTAINNKYIDRMLSSVFMNNRSLYIDIVFVNQFDYNIEKFTDNEFNRLFEVNIEKSSLSKARNAAIDYILVNKMEARYVMFPDDDNSFDKNFFNNFDSVILNNRNYLIDIFCDNTNKLYLKHHCKNSDEVEIDNSEAVISSNLVINYNTFVNVGSFDERLSVGAKYGAGEDMDYYIRCCKLNNTKFIYTKSLYAYHPDYIVKYDEMEFQQILNKFIKYGNGVIFMFCKHKMYYKALYISFRAIGGILKNLFEMKYRLALCYFLVFFSRTAMAFKCIFFRSHMFN